MALFSEATFTQHFNFSAIEESVASTMRLAAKNPAALYLFFQRYTHFNGYASAVISRLASSIGLSRYLFSNAELLVTEESDRGMEIAAQVLSAAADEGANDTPVHRALAQLTLKTVGDYAELSADDRNLMATMPAWLQEIVNEVVGNYQGVPGDIASLVRGMGFHLASEMMGDVEYATLDKVIRHELKGAGFDRYLRENGRPVMIHGHKYTPWCWVVIHSKHEGSGVEDEHSEYALKALNMAVRYRPEPSQQMMTWALEGFGLFIQLQQRLFQEIARECADSIQSPEPSQMVSV
jgi:hypothetical protein